MGAYGALILILSCLCMFWKLCEEAFIEGKNGTQLRENERRYYKVIRHMKYISSRDIYFRIGLDIAEAVNTRLRKSLIIL